MLEVLGQDYVTTAKAKGLARRTVIMRHAFRNSLIPFVTIVGLEFGFLLSGVVVTETVFSWPGVGRLVFNAINQRDIPVVQAAVVMFSLLFVLLNLIVDVVYTRLDPRIRLELTYDRTGHYTTILQRCLPAHVNREPFAAQATFRLGERVSQSGACPLAADCAIWTADPDDCCLFAPQWRQPIRIDRI